MQKPTESLSSGDQAVLHVRGGKLLKGLLTDFTPTAEKVHLQPESDTAQSPIEVQVADLKAIYYVRSFAGNREHKKKRYFGAMEGKGKRIMVRFRDGEILCGFIEGELPWKDGFLTSPDPSLKGFFMQPADPDGNNTKVFVVTTAVEDVRRL
ncbi:MAG TPA: hypothetical protein VFH55_06705 [Nitrospiria bacterium]|nr:hypothetical protein [Nitrospiria bacterium]